MALAAAEAVGPLRACAATLLTLEGEAPVAPREALERVVGAGGVAALAAITQARERGSASGAGGAAALLGAVEIAAGIEARAERLA
jgi:hypothetical protein